MDIVIIQVLVSGRLCASCMLVTFSAGDSGGVGWGGVVEETIKGRSHLILINAHCGKSIDTQRRCDRRMLSRMFLLWNAFKSSAPDVKYDTEDEASTYCERYLQFVQA